MLSTVESQDYLISAVMSIHFYNNSAHFPFMYENVSLFWWGMLMNRTAVHGNPQSICFMYKKYHLLWYKGKKGASDMYWVSQNLPQICPASA